MTKEEAKKHIWNFKSSKYCSPNQVIDKIYSDFENRKCKTCAWYADTNVCVNDESPLCADFVRSSFGCILWEESE